MPKVLTDAYRNSTFILTFTDDKKEYAVIRPLIDSRLSKLRVDAAKEAGADEEIAGSIFAKKLLLEAIKDWRGFYDVTGKELPYSENAIREICECDPDFAAGLALRIRNVARIGELEERKN